MSETAKRIADNLTEIRERIAAAAKRGGRTADDVKLVAVTKYVDVEQAAALVDAGCHDLGESRPQELWHKADSLPSDAVRWHLIGHLQRNKVRRTLSHVTLVHSGDSQRLLAAIDEAAAALDRRMPVLLEVNISGDAEKHGFAADELERLLPGLAKRANIEIAGLMTMAAREGGDQRARRDFAQLRELRERLLRGCPPEISLHELSMGMSRDFETAVEEGATIVRVGSALFAGVEQGS